MGDPFALDLAGDPSLKRLHLDAEAQDSYHRDRNVFAPGVTIEDDLALVVTYSTGAPIAGDVGAPAADPLGRGASERDGALSLLTGLAGNESRHWASGSVS